MQSVQDLKFALRTLRRAPVVTLAALATLALGIGGNTAIFSLIHGVLFNPLSAPEPERLMFVYGNDEDQDFALVSYENYLDLQEQSTTFENLGVFRPQSVAVNGGGEPPERIRGMFVTASFFPTLGERPVQGRAILPGEDVPGGERTAVLSHGFWQRRWGGDPAAIGQTLRFNNEPHTIVGVMPESFRFPMDTTEAWISLQTFPGGLNRENRTLFVTGRLKAGVSAREAGEELEVITARLAASHPVINHGYTSRIEPLSEFLVGERSQRLLLILLTAVAMVLLIGAANVANLQLARATGRRREMAIRAAIGGSRWTLVRQLLTESLVLSMLGGVAGLAVAKAGLQLLESHGPGWIGGLYTVDLNLSVLAFLAAVSLATGVLFGLAPTLRASRTDLVDSLREGGLEPSAGRRGGQLRGALVVAQMALAVMLLIGAGLLIRSVGELQRVDVGFERDNLLTVQFRLPNNKYAEDEQIVQFFDRMLERVAAVPGVLGVASAQDLPFTGDGGRAPILADGVDPGADVQVPVAGLNFVNADYFGVMGIPLVAGRGFSAADRAGSMPATVVSRRVAEALWSGEDAVGRTLRVRGDEDNTLFHVVGVAGDIHNRGLTGEVSPMAYFPYAQQPSHFATIGVRVRAEPMSYAPAVRAAIWEIDPDQPLWEVMTQNDRIGQWTGSQRFTTSLLTVFAAIAVALAAIGIAGVLAYSVGQRTREIGIRLALGAGREQILRQVMTQGLLLLVGGMVIGVVGAALLTRLLEGFLFGVGAVDAVTFALAPALLTIAALVACYLPARKASSVDPLVALRYE